MKLLFAFIAFLLVFCSRLQTAQAFEYPIISDPSLLPNSWINDPQQNLIKNPWFRTNCAFDLSPWTSDPPSLWDNSRKPQNPTDVNCLGNWTGTAARFAKEGSTDPFFPNTPAMLWQVVEANPAFRTLHFHALLVAHRVNQYRAAIYGGNNESGPWTLVWTPFNIVNCLSTDCVNETYGQDYGGVGCNPHPTLGRDCLWEDVTESIPAIADNSNKLGLKPLQKTIPQGYPFYKIEFLMKYPDPDPDLTTGDVGGKLARVFFKVTGSSGPTVTPVPIPGDIQPPGGDGDVDFLDYQAFISLFGKTSSTADFNSNGKVEIFDFNTLVGNFN